jgi:hypothetical protein
MSLSTLSIQTYNLLTILLLTKEHAQDFPILSRIARDFLAILATSIAVEQLFSSAQHLCDNVHSSLEAWTIMEAMCTKIWLKQGLMKLHKKPTM